jgi:hypothetical protein
MMRFADYFGRAFSSVTASQFPWVKLFRESPVTKIVDVSLKFSVLLFFAVDFYTVMRNHEIERLSVVM